MACSHLAETSLDAHNVNVPCDMPYLFRLITMALGRLQDVLRFTFYVLSHSPTLRVTLRSLI